MKRLHAFLWRLRGYIDVRALMRRGLIMGQDCHIMERVVLDPGQCGQIQIGNRVTLAPEVYILAHDASTHADLGYTYIGRVVIEDGVFVGARAMILPNVCIGKNSIVGAGSVVTRDVPEETVVAGNPARVICSREEFREKHRKRFQEGPVFEERYTQRAGVTLYMIQRMNDRMKKGFGYIR